MKIKNAQYEQTVKVGGHGTYTDRERRLIERMRFYAFGELRHSTGDAPYWACDAEHDEAYVLFFRWLGMNEEEVQTRLKESQESRKLWRALGESSRRYTDSMIASAIKDGDIERVKKRQSDLL